MSQLICVVMSINCISNSNIMLTKLIAEIGEHGGIAKKKNLHDAWAVKHVDRLETNPYVRHTYLGEIKKADYKMITQTQV